MRITRKGRLKLGKSDFRIGNFIFTKEGGYIKVRDLDGMVSHSVRDNIVKGQMLSLLIDMAKDGDENSATLLAGYCTVMENVLCCVPFTRPDEEETYLEKLNKATIECFNKNKELYGVREDITDEEDGRILEDQKEIKEFIDKYNV